MWRFSQLSPSSKNNTVEVEFPDLAGCVTFGKDWEEALKNAEDVLAGWLAHAEPQFIKEPSKHQELKHPSGDIVPVAVAEEYLQHHLS